MERLLIKPRLTEKTYVLSQQGVFTFEVPTMANRQQIKKVVEQTYGVTVESVKIAVQTGKAKRFNKGKRAYPGVRQESNIKKAYVRLGKGQTIPAFNQTEENEKESK